MVVTDLSFQQASRWYYRPLPASYLVLLQEVEEQLRGQAAHAIGAVKAERLQQARAASRREPLGLVEVLPTSTYTYHATNHVC